jgi:hypothetical protein
MKEDDLDNVSVLSTSSKSTRFKLPSGPSLRRRTTGDTRRSSRRFSDVGSVHDSEGNLTPALELEIQGSRKEQDSWGVGDEVAMGLD